MIGSAWQRCRVHFMRNVLAKVTRTNTHMVIAAIQTIFAQPDADAVTEQFARIVGTLTERFPDVASMLEGAREDLLAFAPSPSRTGARSGRPTLSSACTARSSGAPM